MGGVSGSEAMDGAGPGCVVRWGSHGLCQQLGQLDSVDRRVGAIGYPVMLLREKKAKKQEKKI